MTTTATSRLLTAALLGVALLAPRGRAHAQQDSVADAGDAGHAAGRVADRGAERAAADRAAVAAEVAAFYRDLRTRQWAALLDHFWPAKITARWEPPLADRAWQRAPEDARAPAKGSRAPTRPCLAAAANDAPDVTPSADVRVVGAWARVLVTRCGERSAERSARG
jgi:hypothetical protein